MLLRTKHYRKEQAARRSAEAKNVSLETQLEGSRAHADQLQRELDEYQALGLALPIARDIQQILDEEYSSGTPYEEALEIAKDRATQIHRDRLIQKQASELETSLTEEQELAVETEVADLVPVMTAEIKAKLATTKPSLLETRTGEKRTELEKLETEDLLRQVDTEATRLALASLETIALERAEIKAEEQRRTVWIERLSQIASNLHYVPISMIPAQEVVVVDLTNEQLSQPGNNWKRNHPMQRTLVLRLIKPELGIFTVLDDTWKESNDKLRVKLALDDGEIVILTAPNGDEIGPNFSKAAVPHLHKCNIENAAYTAGLPVELDSLEVGRVRIGSDWIMAAKENK